MSEGSPSLEEDPKPLLNSLERNVFTPKLTTPIFAGSVKLIHRGSDFGESETDSFLTEAQRNELALQEIFSYGDGSFDKAESETEGRNREIQAMSVLSTYQDNLSHEMNTERDNVSDASTREAEECGCGDQPGMDLHGLKNKSNGKPTTCSIMLSGFKTNPTLLFNDGKRTTDFVLVYDTAKEEEMKPEVIEYRRVFEKNLVEEGLELERDSPPEMLGLCVVKIHAPLLVLRDYGELLKLRMPMKEHSTIRRGGKMNAILQAAMYMSKFSALKDVKDKSNSVITSIKNCYLNFMEKFKLDPEIFPERKHRLTAIYSKDKEYLFDTTSDCFWTPSNRSRIVRFILDRKKFSESNARDEFAFGISRLIANQGYTAAYALHDGDLKTPGSMRHLLYTEWASLHRLHKMQPLDYIKDYFGVKIGLYFAWLGFYTYMLLPASIIGLLSIIYSAATVFSNEPSEQVCNYNSSIIMCPLCDYHCDYWDLKDSCLQFRVTYLFDNITTVIFAIVMSFWAAVFLELWKRYSAEMAHRWDLTGFDMYEEHPRPQYLARLAHVRRTQLNVVTGQREPMVPFWRMRLPIALLSFSVVGLLVLMAIATVLGVVFYRMSLMGALMFQNSKGALLTSNPVMFTSATAALINLCFIFVFNYIYQYLAVWLTEKELLRTQTEFEDSLTVKNYLLEFVNYYASIFYIAFFKGKHVGRPGNYIRLFGQRQEECPPGGCLLELSIQLAIIMIGKQCLNAFLELLMPYLKRWYNIMTNMGHRRKIKSKQQWVQDLKLVDMGEMGLFAEYLEMVLQYGFVTIFVAAFPLAPFFALLNNILEMRLDAKKFLVQYRRPVPQRVSDIGVWYPILDSIGKLSIITNGFIIAFTSEFIPRLVYLYQHGDMRQFVNHTLTDFNITVLEHPPWNSAYNQTMCSFPGYWDPGENSSYEHASSYWHIIGARLAFVVVFENVVALLIMIVKWAIPDISGDLRDRIRRETYVINQFIIEETHARHAQEARRISKNRSSVSFEERTGDVPADLSPDATQPRTSPAQADQPDGQEPSPSGSQHGPPPGQGGPIETVAQTHWNALLTASLDDFDLATNVDTSNIGDLTRRVLQRERGEVGQEQDGQGEQAGEHHDGPTYV